MARLKTVGMAVLIAEEPMRPLKAHATARGLLLCEENQTMKRSTKVSGKVLNDSPRNQLDPAQPRPDNPAGLPRRSKPERGQLERLRTLAVINGPNLNLLGQRERGMYGTKTLKEIEDSLAHRAREHNINLEFFQSNIEGELVGELQRAGRETDGVLLNAGAYTHTSVAIRDAIAAISVPVVEVHLSNIQAREEFRRHSLLADVCTGCIAGFGADSYTIALFWFQLRLERQMEQSKDA